MKIILDAMGGDNAPEAPVLGALDAVKTYGADIILVGRGEEILEVLKKNGLETLPEGIEIAHADDVVDMHDDPGTVIHKRKNSSMVVGLKMLADGKGDAFVSAGSTGALLTGATLLVKRVRGIRRASMAPAMPTKAGTKVIVCDCGANAECTPEFLLQFGLVASAYSKYTLGVENPRVGLLNIGAEDSKGTQLQKDAYALLKDAGEKGLINFTGNVEARDVPLGAVDVVVCDGFNGNVLIKSIEGTAMFMGSMLKRMFKKNLGSKIGYLLSQADAFRRCCQGLLANHIRPHPGQLPLRTVGEIPVQVLRHQHSQHAVSQKFQPLVAEQAVVPALVGVGGVGQRVLQQRDIVKLVADDRFQILKHRLHFPSGPLRSAPAVL